ncbi:hypothetical protein [Paenibacillus vini]|uniref:Lipoprotein n=1 Tax=Paenibacillus vini TaxID=1476024 RepID=A0ABQ4MFQ3_9BACL|nr:hypothetical protein [Paenibacillus vini]GIP54808.1 hypothetical protein J42TS3_38430 [Paenibacillus vini]
MKQTGLVILVLAIVSLVTACNSDNSDKTVMSETTMELTKNDQVKAPDNNSIKMSTGKESVEKFSYLKQLPLEKQEAFTRFEEERKRSYLYNFTPEDMVLVYLYCLSVGDPDLLYDITFSGGQLPDKDKFREDYFEYAMTYDSETAVHYRYYDSIKVDESTSEENKVTVLVTVSIETTTHTLALGLQKEDQIWKMDIYHLIKEYKDKANQSKTG